METIKKIEPMRAFMQGMGSKASEVISHDTDFEPISSERQDKAISMTDCPKWDSCSAPVCPLHNSWQGCSHLDGERVCSYLLELSKPNGRDVLGESLQAYMVERIESQAEAIYQRYAPIRKAIKRASKSKSKMDAGRALTKQRMKTSFKSGGLP